MVTWIHCQSGDKPFFFSENKITLTLQMPYPNAPAFVSGSYKLPIYYQ